MTCNSPSGYNDRLAGACFIRFRFGRRGAPGQAADPSGGGCYDGPGARRLRALPQLGIAHGTEPARGRPPGDAQIGAPASQPASWPVRKSVGRLSRASSRSRARRGPVAERHPSGQAHVLGSSLREVLRADPRAGQEPVLLPAARPVWTEPTAANRGRRPGGTRETPPGCRRVIGEVNTPVRRRCPCRMAESGCRAGPSNAGRRTAATTSLPCQLEEIMQFLSPESSAYSSLICGTLK